MTVNYMKQTGWLLGLGLLVLSLSGCGINNIPTYEEDAKAKFSQVLNTYQRRADLVPNLVATVKGFAEHEKEVLMGVVEARSKVSSMQVDASLLNNPQAFKAFQDNQAALSSALSRLLVTVERYPELKSSSNFLTLQSQLEGTENRAAVARRDYIEAVKRYNTELRTIPGKWWKSFLYPESKPMANFTVEEKVMAVPEVKF
ncbi:MAG: LemA family protein [Gammaproteobacteria bacterium]|nr:LemA family protein [Gammaproteobacteria bacterium]